MSNVKKEEGKAVSAYIETRNLDELTAKTGNLYKSINVISARSSQMNSKLKEELHRKLEEFASATDNLEEVFENREQLTIQLLEELKLRNQKYGMVTACVGGGQGIAGIFERRNVFQRQRIESDV